MRFSRRHISFNLSCTLLLLLALMSAATTTAARAQEANRCPDLEISGPIGKIDRNQPLRFVAVAGDMADDKITYAWNVSVPATIKKVGEEPDEVDIDLKDYPRQKITISVEINGLPEGCPKTAVYELDEVLDSPEKTEAVMDSIVVIAPQPEIVDAPSLSLSCPVKVDEGTPLYFNVNVDGVPLSSKLTYNWKVSPASIISGQSTPAIKVETKGQGNQIIRAQLSVRGQSLFRIISCATMVKATPYAYKLDEFSSTLSFDEKELRLRRFSLRLRTGLEEHAYIIAYGPKDAARDEGQMVRRYLVGEHGIDAARVVIIDGGRRKETAIELWVVQPGAPLPFGRSIID